MKHHFTPTKASIALAVLLAAVPAVSFAQHNHAHEQHMADALVQPGQGAFAATAEIVALLRQDTDTDWTKVNIAALRQHLADMSELMMLSDVNTVPTAEGIRISIELDQPANAAAGRMVPAHGPVLAKETGWKSNVTRDGNMLIWDVASTADSDQIKGLGFFGLMAIGDHHRAHHLALAQGKPAH